MGRVAVTRWSTWALLLATWLTPPAAHARGPAEGSSLLQGGFSLDEPSATAPLDPRLPPGALRDDGREPLGELLCSERRPVCVAGAHPLRLGALAMLEEAYERHRFGAGLASPTLHEAPSVWLLAPGPLRFEVAERPALGFDRGLGRCRGGAITREAAQRCLAGLTLAERAPATSTAWLLGFARNASQQLLGFDAAELDWLDDAQRAPERALLDATLPDAPLDRSALFWRYLDDVARAAAPAEASFLALALAATRTPPQALRREAEPDALDVLRRSLGGGLHRFAELYDDFAAARLDVGRPDGFLLLTGGPTRGPEFAWELTATELPRRLALPRPLAPSGSTYVRLRLAPADETSTFAVRVECERPVSYVWSIARRDARGAALGRVRLPFRESDHRFEQRIEPLAEQRELILIGSALGGVDLAHPYDPEHAPHEPHGCNVYWTRLP